MLQLFFLQLSRRILPVAMRLTVGGDAEHYTTVGASAAFLLLLVHELPLTIKLGFTLEFVFFFSAHVQTATARYRALTTQQQSALL